MSLNERNSVTPAPTTPIMAEQPGVDLWEYLRIIRRRWLLITLTVVVVLGLTAFVTLRMTKIYRATGTLQIETQAPQVLGKSVEDVVEMGLKDAVFLLESAGLKVKVKGWGKVRSQSIKPGSAIVSGQLISLEMSFV